MGKRRIQDAPCFPVSVYKVQISSPLGAWHISRDAVALLREHVFEDHDVWYVAMLIISYGRTTGSGASRLQA